MPFLFDSFRQFGVTENVQRAKSILAKQKVDPRDEDYQIIRNMLDKKMGWVGLFTYLRYEAAVPAKIEDLAQLYDKLMSVEPLLKNLPLTVDKYESYEALSDDLDRLVLQRKVTRFYQELTAVQKASFKKMTTEERDRLEMTVCMFYDVLKVEQQKDILSKISYYKTFKTLLTNFETSVEANMQDFTMESVLRLLEEIPGGAKVVFKDLAKQRLVIRIMKYETNLLLNSATQWCIRNERVNWETYVGAATMNTHYTIYNFKKRFSDIACMIAVTIKPDGSIRELMYKNDTEVGEAELKRVAKSQGYWSALRPMEGEELAHAQEMKKVCDKLSQFEFDDENPDMMKGYIQAVHTALEKDLVDSDTKGRILLNLMWAEQWDEIPRLMETDFVADLGNGSIEDIMNVCFSTDKTDFLKDLVRRGMRITPYCGRDNYARWLNLTDKPQQLRDWIVKCNGDLESLGAVLATRNVGLFEWFVDKFCAGRDGQVDANQVSNRLYPVLRYGGGSIPASRINFEMLQAIHPYLTNIAENRSIYRQFYFAHEEPRLFALVAEQVANKQMDVLQGINSVHFKTRMTYIRGFIEAGFTNVIPQYAGMFLADEHFDLAEAVFSLSEKRDESYTEGGYQRYGFQTDPEEWLQKAIGFATKFGAFEGMKWLHKRGFLLSGERSHNFSKIVPTLEFTDRFEGQSVFNGEFVYYLHKLGYSVLNSDLAKAYGMVKVDEEELGDTDPTSFAKYIESRYLECHSEEDYDRVIAIIKKRYPKTLPLEFLGTHLHVRKNHRVLDLVYGNGRVDVKAYVGKPNWLRYFSPFVKSASTSFDLVYSIQGWSAVSEADLTEMIVDALGTVDRNREPLNELCALLCHEAAYNSKNSQAMQLEVYENVLIKHELLDIKETLKTTEAVATQALMRSVHQIRLHNFHALNQEGFVKAWTLETAEILLDNLNQRQSNFSVGTYLGTDTLKDLVNARQITEDLSPLLPLYQKHERHLSPIGKHFMRVTLFPNATPANESYLSDFARFGKRRG